VLRMIGQEPQQVLTAAPNIPVPTQVIQPAVMPRLHAPEEFCFGQPGFKCDQGQLTHANSTEPSVEEQPGSNAKRRHQVQYPRSGSNTLDCSRDGRELRQGAPGIGDPSWS
jgi:hypothetical protein